MGTNTNPNRRSLIFHEIIRFCQYHGCSESELVNTFGIPPSSAHHIFQIIKELCHDGFLGAGCEIEENKVVLKR